MKLLLLPLLLLGAGVGYGLRGSKEEIPPACAAGECHVTVECTGPKTCLVTCYDANGNVLCRQEVSCDEACEKKCDLPCQGQGTCPQGL